MEIVNTVINFGKNHWIELLAILGGVDIILGVVSKLTPFKWDDNLYSILHNWLSKIKK